MTVAYNLSQLANKVNTSGQLDASTGLVNALPAISGVNLTNLNASNLASGTVPNARLTNGSVIQTVYGSASTVTSTRSASYVDATDCYVTITPTSATSKILVNFSVNAQVDAYTTDGVQCVIQIVRNSTALGNTAINGFGAVFSANLPLMFLDSPATTSSITYKVQFKRYWYYGSADNAVAINANPGTPMTTFMVLQEIKGS
jgi:hypothetical protein